MNLRPYQQECIDAVNRGWEKYSRQLAIIPTGGGKTIIFSKLAAANHRRTLILAHRDKLVTQAIEKLESATGIVAGREKADSYALKSDHVVVASIQTMMRRKARWKRTHFGLIVCDEAHHSVSKSWDQVIEYFAPFNRLLGVTATPERSDGVSLLDSYEHKAFEIDMITLIRQGYLSPIKIKTCPIKLDLESVAKRAGDFAAEDVGHALEPYLPILASEIIKHAGTRRTLIFLPLIATSQKLVAHLKNLGAKVEHVDGTMKDSDSVLERFERNEFQFLCNAMLLTEGFDDPGISCVVNLRPTQSVSLLKQIIGRGTRIAPGKDFLLVLEFLWQCEKYNIMRSGNLLPGVKQETVNAMNEIADARAGSNKQEPMDLFEMESEATQKREATLAKALDKLKHRKGEFIDAEEFASRVGAKDDYIPQFAWQKKPMTIEQIETLTKAGVDVETVTCRGHAMDLIDAYQNHENNKPASDRVKARMRAAGDPNWETATAKQGRAFFARRAWRYSR